MNKWQRQLIDLQRANVIDDKVEEGEEALRQARLRESCFYGTLADLRKRIEHFRQKPKLNLLDKRLLLGIFKGQVELSDCMR